MEQKEGTKSSSIYVEAPIKALKKADTGSIIPLQQEFHFHLSLVARTYQSIAKLKDKNAEIQEALASAQKKVNELVMREFARGLQEATRDTKGGELDISKLNKTLDKARKKIMPEAHAIFMQEIVNKTGVILEPKDFKGIKHTAEITTASGDNLLHVDSKLGLATLVRHSEVTAHGRGQGKIADRQLITHYYKNSTITENPNTRTQIRIPSLDVKEGIRGNAVIEDIAKKLQTISKNYRFSELLENESKPAQAFIYNLYTSLHDRFGDINGNLQTQGADYILKGMHQYNASQINTESPVFCFVQNIPVNGFGATLSHTSRDPLIREATLMADMAFMHTLYEASDNKSAIDQVFAKYRGYLEKEGRDAYFSKSPEGQDAIQQIAAIKEQWKKIAPQSDAEPEVKARYALQKLVAHNLHCTHDYAKLVQALSVYVEKASIGGCKSGNERAQAINGRVAILDTQDKDIVKIINELSRADYEKKVVEQAGALKSQLDKVYNDKGLQGAASVVSLLDQGASAKVEAKPGGIYFSRNYAEEKELTNLHQSKAGKMQAHKNLTKEMQKAWDFHPVSWWKRMKSSRLGVVGAILGTVTIIPAVVVAVYNAVDNAKRSERLDEIRKNAKEEASSVRRDDVPIESSYQRMGAKIGNGKKQGFTQSPVNELEEEFGEQHVIDLTKKADLPPDEEEKPGITMKIK